MQNFKKYCIGYLMIASLVIAGCEVVSNQTAYELAVDGNIQELKRLLDEGLDVNKPYEPYDGATLIFGAVDGESSETIKFLIERGADVNFKDHSENTPLIHAVNQGQDQIVAFLLDHGARVSGINKAGHTAFYLTVYRGSGPMTKLLIERGAQIDFQDEGGNTPLHVAARNDNAGLVQLLLNGKARVSIKNKRGFTPLYASEEMSYRETSGLLKKYGARLANPAPTPSNLKKWYGKIVQGGPVRVRQVIKQNGIFRKVVYSHNGALVSGTIKKPAYQEEDYLEYFDLNMDMDLGQGVDLNSFVNMDDLLDRKFIQSVRVFDTQTWNSPYLLTDEEDLPSGDVFSMDGRHLISGSKESTALVWDLATGKVTRRFGTAKGNVLGLGEFSGKQHLLVGESFKLEFGASSDIWDFFYFVFAMMTGGTDHSLWIYDLDSGEIVKDLTGHKSAAFLARFSPDGRYVVSLGGNFLQSQGTLQIWNAETGEGLPVPEEVRGIRSFAVFPDSKRLALAKTKEILIMDLESKKILKRFNGMGGRMGLMDKGQLLACLDNKQLVFFDSETGEVKADLNFEKEFDKLGDDYNLTEYFVTMAVSPQGDTLLATTNHGKMIVFELKNS